MVLVQHQLHQNMSSLLVLFERKLSHNMPAILTIDTIPKYYIEIVNQAEVGWWVEEQNLNAMRSKCFKKSI